MQSYGLVWANASNTPFRRYKHWVHEGGIATPLIAHWPAVLRDQAKGGISHAPGHLVDVMPTILGLLNESSRLEGVRGIDGINLADQLRRAAAR